MIAWVQPRVFLEASPSHRASRGICRLSMSAEEDVPIVPKMVRDAEFFSVMYAEQRQLELHMPLAERTWG